MLLRASSRAVGTDADLHAAVRPGAGDSGVPGGDVLGEFADAVCRRRDDLDVVRSAVGERFGAAGLVEAAATVAIFSGLVRVADGTGIPVDDGAIAESDDFRTALGLHGYAGAVNTDPRRGDPTRLDGTVEALFR